MDKKTRTDQSGELQSKTSLFYGPSSVFKDVFVLSFKKLNLQSRSRKTLMTAATEMTSTSGELILSAELLPHHKNTAWTHQLVLGCAINWRLHGFQILLLWPPQAPNESLLTAQHTRGRNEQRLCHPWAVVSWLFIKESDPEAKQCRPAMKLWGWWVVSCFNNTAVMRTTCTGSASKRSWRCGFIRFLVVFYRSHAGTKGDWKNLWSLTCEKRALAFIHSSKSANWQ